MSPCSGKVLVVNDIIPTHWSSPNNIFHFHLIFILFWSIKFIKENVYFIVDLQCCVSFRCSAE